MNHSKHTYDLIDGTTDARWLLLRGSEVGITITLQRLPNSLLDGLETVNNTISGFFCSC